MMLVFHGALKTAFGAVKYFMELGTTFVGSRVSEEFSGKQIQKMMG